MKAVIAILAVVAIVLAGGMALVLSDDDGEAVERRVQELSECRGEPPPRVSCSAVSDDRWRCELARRGATATVTVDGDHPEVSAVC
jgi:hypothetical protein